MTPPLPEPSFEWPSLCRYTEGEVEAYGKQCREAALEEAAKTLERVSLNGICEDTRLTGYTASLLMASAINIRSLK